MSFHPSQVIYEDNHLIIINKYAGQLSQGDQSGDPSLADDIKAYLKKKYNKPGDVFLGVVHRLDRPTSGAIIYARTSKSLSRMNEQIRERTINKTYWAITDRRPKREQDTLEHHLVKIAKKNYSIAYAKPRNNTKPARLHFRLLSSIGKHHLLEVKLETGRHHQIRAQLAKIGCPIVGDLKYGAPEPNPDKSILLHAQQLEFVHPVKKEPMMIIAPVPKLQNWEKFGDPSTFS